MSNVNETNLLKNINIYTYIGKGKKDLNSPFRDICLLDIDEFMTRILNQCNGEDGMESYYKSIKKIAEYEFSKKFGNKVGINHPEHPTPFYYKEKYGIEFDPSQYKTYYPITWNYGELKLESMLKNESVDVKCLYFRPLVKKLLEENQVISKKEAEKLISEGFVVMFTYKDGKINVDPMMAVEGYQSFQLLPPNAKPGDFTKIHGILNVIAKEEVARNIDRIDSTIKNQTSTIEHIPSRGERLINTIKNKIFRKNSNEVKVVKDTVDTSKVESESGKDSK